MQAILNHLWQSTAFAATAWLLTLALNRNRAQTRYWVWFAASMKFLVPVALLVAAGSQMSWRATAPPISAPLIVQEVAQPLEAGVPVEGHTAPAHGNPIPELLLLAWAIGFIAIVARWGREWTRMHANVRAATTLDLGLAVPVRSSAALFEPGVFGVFRPVLLLPEGITERLTAAQLSAVLAHEMCHIRRRDNLATALPRRPALGNEHHPIAAASGSTGGQAPRKEAPNLGMLGGSVFRACGSCNPTLTIQALA